MSTRARLNIRCRALTIDKRPGVGGESGARRRHFAYRPHLGRLRVAQRF